VLRELGIADALDARLRPFPNGATAMRALADHGQPGALGCTQVTEILYTKGVTLVGPLPAAFELATLYSIAVSKRATDAAAAKRFQGLLADPVYRALRAAGGFEPSR
jgi:molybdate transport system substrate-binding protein